MATTEELIEQAKLEALISAKGYIQIDSAASPAVLAGILGVSVPLIYQGRQDGKLPVSASATYRECLQHYINYYKKKINSRSTNMSEAKLAQDIRNGIAKEEQQWLEIKKLKLEVLEAKEMKELFEPIFHLIRANLVNLARKHPELQKDIDTMMESWFLLGTQIEEKARTDSDAYVQSMLDKELVLEEAEGKVFSKFDIEKHLDDL